MRETKKKPERKTSQTEKGMKKYQVPYASVRAPKSGMTMFQMMDATNYPKKVVNFLQERGCLAFRMLCPDCNGEMSLLDRADKI